MSERRESKQWRLNLGGDPWNLSQSCRNQGQGMGGAVKINQAWEWNKEMILRSHKAR